MQVLREIMAVYESSLVGDEKSDERDAGGRRILDVMVDPAVEMCSAASEEKQRLRPRWDKHVFVLNCLTHLQASPQRIYPVLDCIDHQVRSSERFGSFFIHRAETAEYSDGHQRTSESVNEGTCQCLYYHPLITSVKMSWTSSTTTF